MTATATHPDLRTLNRWLCWKIYPRPDGGLEKEPRNPNGGMAACDDPKTWVDYKTAKTAVANRKYDGYGLVLGKEVGLVIVDFDHCRNPKTGVVDDWTLEEIKKLNTYTEISVSGTGLHALAWGEIPYNLKRNGGEIYSSDKMFVLTGDVFNGLKTIEERNMSDIHGRIEAGRFRPGLLVCSYDDVKFRELIADDWASHFTSRSEAVQSALVTLAKKHNYDPEIVAEEFEETKLCAAWAEKWARLSDKEVTKAIAFAKKHLEPDAGPLGPRPVPPSPPNGKATVEFIDLDTISGVAEPMPRYPTEVWEGTEYAQFAEICKQGNYIPSEFFIESIKTVVGAVAGNMLRILGIEGGLPRFYTVLINSGGSGKGTAISYACEVFREDWGGKAKPLLWSPIRGIETISWVHIGACTTAFSSAPGMQRTAEKGQTRWLQIFEELSSIIESTGIQGSGQSLLAANRQLYDSEYFTTTATAQRDSSAGRAQNTLLAGTTPTLWAEMFAGKQVEGSGLFQRFNIVTADNIQRVGTLMSPDLEAFSVALSERVAKLDGAPLRFNIHKDSLVLMNEWFEKASASVDGEEPDPDDYGRINVLGWRNAIHLCWLKGRTTVLPDDMERVIKLCDYQLAARKKCKPSTGENPTALLEDKIRRIVRERGKIKMREARKRINADRYGITTWERAVKNLVSAEDIRYAEEKTPSGQTVKWLVSPRKVPSLLSITKQNS